MFMLEIREEKGGKQFEPLSDVERKSRLLGPHILSFLTVILFSEC